MSLATSGNGGTFRTPRQVRLESVMRTNQHFRNYPAPPNRTCGGHTKIGEHDPERTSTIPNIYRLRPDRFDRGCYGPIIAGLMRSSGWWVK
jgi:hypothetical protein